jgi:enterochelin esterase-like enzyme
MKYIFAAILLMLATGCCTTSMSVSKPTDTAFTAFLRKLETARDKSREIENFFAAQKAFPIIEDDSLIHFVYRGEADSLGITGDMTGWKKTLAMTRVVGTSFFYVTFQVEPDVRWDYQFVRNGKEFLTDPLNPFITPSGMGDHSQVAMPKWNYAKHLAPPAASKPVGSLIRTNFKSDTLGNTRLIQIYLPAGYDAGKGKYAVVIINDGAEAITFALMKNTLDNLIGTTIPPVIAVFVPPISPEERPFEYIGDRKEKFVSMLVTELVPYIDKNYPTLARPSARAIMGISNGGHMAFYAAFKHPEVFGMAAGQSPNVTPELYALVKNSSNVTLQLYLDWGKYDLKTPYLGKPRDFVEYGRRLAALLVEKGYSYKGREVNDGHDWASWRNRIDEILNFFFPFK